MLFRSRPTTAAVARGGTRSVHAPGSAQGPTLFWLAHVFTRPGPILVIRGTRRDRLTWLRGCHSLSRVWLAQVVPGTGGGPRVSIQPLHRPFLPKRDHHAEHRDCGDVRPKPRVVCRANGMSRTARGVGYQTPAFRLLRALTGCLTVAFALRRRADRRPARLGRSRP